MNSNDYGEYQEDGNIEVFYEEKKIIVIIMTIAV